MDGSSDELPEWKLIPSGKKIPYGIQYLTDTVILDVHTEKVIFKKFLTFDFKLLNIFH